MRARAAATGQQRAAVQDGEQRRTAIRAQGCSIHRGDYTRTTRSSRRTQCGGRRGGGDDAGRRTAAGRGEASPATLPRRWGAQRREQAAPTGPLPCGGTSGELDGGGGTADWATYGGGGTADGAAYGGGGARVRRRPGASSG
jgi:hypothetical protein